MKLVTFMQDQQKKAGLLIGEFIIDICGAAQQETMLRKLRGLHSVLDIIRRGPDAQKILDDFSAELEVEGCSEDWLLRKKSVKLLAPIPRPARNIFCVGRNYFETISEMDKASGKEVGIPKLPSFFTKTATAVIGTDDFISVNPDYTSKVDYEGELMVVIGRGGKNISGENAMSHVFGFTICNDVSARDIMKAHYQVFKGKNLDTFCPIGPAIVTADEVDYKDLWLKTTVNGEVRQSCSTAKMIVKVENLISILSRSMTLEPGDMLSTGTPEGIGAAMNPPRFLKDGDVVEISVTGIGTLRNQIRYIK